MTKSRRSVSFVPVLPLLALAVLPAAAAQREGPTMQELLRRIELLENEVERLRRDSCPAPRAADTGAPEASGESGDSAATPRPQTARPPVAEEAQARRVVVGEPGSPKGSAVAGYKDGFFVQSPSGESKLKINGLLQTDGRFFAGGSDDNPNQFVLRRARFSLKGEFGRFGFQIEPDFAGDSPSLQDAFFQAEFARWATLRTGRFKTPFGIERLQSSRDLLFVERSLAENLVPGRDVGLMLSGELADRRLSYQAALLNGTPDGSSSVSDVNDSFDVVLRLYATPFAPSTYSPLRGAGVGIAATYGREQGDDDDDQLSSYRTSGRARFFEWDGDTIADGGHWRVSPQAMWYEGPFGMLTEYVVSDQQVSSGGARAWVMNQAWQVRASVLLTGEKASYKGVEPDRPFDFGRGGWGAWELGARWASLDVDGDVFRLGFADPDEAARHADAFAMAVNWYLTRHVSVRANYERTMFGGGSDRGDRDDEDVFLTRLQLQF